MICTSIYSKYDIVPCTDSTGKPHIGYSIGQYDISKLCFLCTVVYKHATRKCSVMPSR